MRDEVTGAASVPAWVARSRERAARRLAGGGATLVAGA